MILNSPFAVLIAVAGIGVLWLLLIWAGFAIASRENRERRTEQQLSLELPEHEGPARDPLAPPPPVRV